MHNQKPTTYTLNIYKTKAQHIPSLTYNSSPTFKHSYLPLLQLAVEQYADTAYYDITDNTTGEIVATNRI